MGTGKLSGKPDGMLGETCNGLASHPGGVAILLVASCYGNWDKLRLCGPLSLCADFTSLRQTPLGPEPSVCLRDVSILRRVKF